jgi:inosose dehydratase
MDDVRAPQSPVDRIAGAPISGGVYEVPDRGYQLAPSPVLAEMRQVGLGATESGPEGFLPPDPDAMAAVLAAHGPTAVGGFPPVVLHERTHDPLPAVERLLDGYAASGAATLVLSAATGRDNYDSRPDLDEDGWRTLLANLDRLTTLAGEHGVRAVLHPHVGTMIETGPEVQRVLADCSVSLCLDTGHRLVGGTDPADVARQVPDRIAHTHLQDVDAPAIVEHLVASGYTGWYVLEQDTVLTDEPASEGPAADVHTGAEHLRAPLTRRALVP